MVMYKLACPLMTERHISKIASLRHLHSSTALAARVNQENITQRELLLDILNANATRRDARQYLAHFRPRVEEAQMSKPYLEAEDPKAPSFTAIGSAGVNLGYLYGPPRAIQDSPIFSHGRPAAQTSFARAPLLHVALILLRNPSNIDDQVLDGLMLTLAQLTKLGMKIILVLKSCTCEKSGHDLLDVSGVSEQADRFARIFLRHSTSSPRFISDALDIDAGGTISLALSNLITQPLERGIIPILPTFARTQTGQLQSVSVTDLMAAMTEMLPSIRRCDEAKALMSLDRIIILDQLGGIPSRARGNDSHIFINLEQEFMDIKEELQGFASTKIETRKSYHRHLENLGILHECLYKLDPSSSGVIISPREAAMSSQASMMQPTAIQAGTRRQKNTLIHNLLTNKPMVSSSLPTGRLRAMPPETQAATLVKRGMHLTIIPRPNRPSGWPRPLPGCNTLRLEHDSRIDFPRLLHLIENSFARELDVEHYLDRIRGRIAGVIVAGAYEGGAILTWEQPPGTSESSRLVPYLDKFAVLQSSQGSAGVADILFQAMVRTCFPHGVCWRSRNDNPVNRWYLERAKGSWQIPGSKWTMFWTGEDVTGSTTRFDDYVNTCRHIVPSFKGIRPD